MREFVTLDNVSTENIFSNVNLQLFPQFFQQNDDSELFAFELPIFQISLFNFSENAKIMNNW